MDKEIYKYLKDEDVITSISSEIMEAFRTKMNQQTVDYDFEVAAGTGQLKEIKPNTFFNFDTNLNSDLDKFKKALFHDDLEGLTQEQENLLVEDVSEYLKEVATNIVDNYKQELREKVRKNIMPGSSPEDFPFENIFITSIDVADWAAIPEPQKHLLKIGKKQGSFINTDVVINYVHNKQEETGMTVEDILDKEIKDKNPIFSDIISLEQGDKYLYDINVALFVDYSLAEKSMEQLTKIKNKIK
jgi:hypothetical protein